MPCTQPVKDSVYLRCASALIAIIAFSSAISSAAHHPYSEDLVSGVVQDHTGAPVSSAQVFLYDGKTLVAQSTTGADGEFSFKETPGKSGILIVRARGFAIHREVLREDLTTRLQIVLDPAPIRERVVVTATRVESRLGDVPASIRVLSAADLTATAALRIDDALRQIPGFQLFRRSGSRTANPTSQGVSLRGVGASGASRSLVLADGIPLNDPFGGWVYWGRVPHESLGQIEVMRGPASDLYGSGALGGVINLITKRIEAPQLSLETSYGKENTADASLFMGTRKGRWRASLAGELFNTDGYILVGAGDRGAIDTPANSRDAALDLKLQFDATKSSSFFPRPLTTMAGLRSRPTRRWRRAPLAHQGPQPASVCFPPRQTTTNSNRWTGPARAERASRFRYFGSPR